jgi:hypothetical protein
LKDTYDERGEYRILAPYLRSQWGEDTQTMTLKMSLSEGGSHLWAWFDFGVLSGIMRSWRLLPKKVGDTAHFLWRGREEGEGEMMYGEQNTACITFLGDGKIKGKMNWMGEWEFVGTKVHRRGDKDWCKSTIKWKEEWRDIDTTSYEAMMEGRMGGSSDYDEDGCYLDRTQGPRLTGMTWICRTQHSSDNWNRSGSQTKPWNRIVALMA